MKKKNEKICIKQINKTYECHVLRFGIALNGKVAESVEQNESWKTYASMFNTNYYALVQWNM